MTRRPFICAVFVFAMMLSRQVVCQAATTPSSQPNANDNADAKRLTFLGNQLTADEAAIDAINKALVQAGYKASVAGDKAASAAKGNERMDRKGGAPVRWQDFYGRTAKDFIMHDVGSPVYHQVQRPTQFNYIYHANNTQIAAAKAEVDALGRKLDTLLARRKQLEAEQSALWATIAFESIGNRDISLRPLYRDKLRADPTKVDDNHPEPPTVKALAAAVLYVRTADAAATGVEPELDTDQGACYKALRAALDGGFKSLRDAEANFEDAAGVDPAQSKQLSGIVSGAKTILSLCIDLSEAYDKAQDAEQAKEEARRQLYRGTMQESLFGFAEAVGRLDDQLEELSKGWDVKPQRGVRSADKVTQISIQTTPGANTSPSVPPRPSTPIDANVRTAAPRADAPVVAVPAQRARGAAVDWVRDYSSGRTPLPDNWSVSGGELRAGDHPQPLKLDSNETGPFDLHLEYTLLSSRMNTRTYFEYKKLHCWYILSGKNNGFAHEPNMWARHAMDPNGPILVPGRRYSLVIQVREKSTTAFLDGKRLTHWESDEKGPKVDPSAPIAPHGISLHLHGPAIVHVLELQMVGPAYVDTTRILPVQPATPPATVP